MPNSTDLLDVEDVVVSFGPNRVLQGLTLTAAPAAITAVLGPNGAGKTTFIRCCTGLVSPASGSIRILDDVPGGPRASVGVGVMPQSTGAWSGIKADELLRYLATLYSDPLPVDGLIDELGIGKFARTPYRRLSGGQQQLVNLAGAIIGRPRLVFLDEPTAGMDPHVRRHTWDIVAGLREAGVGVVLTTHAMEEAAAMADVVHIVDAGRVVLSGTVAELTRDASLEDVFLSHTRAEA